MIRHASRHVHQTVINYLRDQLDELGWLSAGDVPFGLSPIELIESRPFVGSALDNRIKPGMVAITLGNEMPVVEEELGGPLVLQEYPIFCDVFMDGESAALALATDIRDAFLGRHATSVRTLPLVNQATGEPVADWLLCFEDIERVAPEHNFPVSWHSVHATAEAYFHEVIY